MACPRAALGDLCRWFPGRLDLDLHRRFALGPGETLADEQERLAGRDGALEIVLVHRRVPPLWALPKGTPDSGETHAKHQKNFIESVRDNVAPNCDIELGVRVQTIVSMAEASYRKGKSMQFDQAKMKMTRPAAMPASDSPSAAGKPDCPAMAPPRNGPNTPARAVMALKMPSPATLAPCRA